MGRVFLPHMDAFFEIWVGFSCLRIDVSDLHHGGGQIGADPAGYIHFVHHSFGRENFGTAFAAEEDAALVEHAQAFGLGAAGRTGGHLQGDTVEKAHIDGIEAAVEGDRLHVGVDIEKLRRAAADHLTAAEDFLGGDGGIKAQVFDAVLVTATVEDLPGMDTDGLADAAQIADRARHSVFSHEITS